MSGPLTNDTGSEVAQNFRPLIFNSFLYRLHGANKAYQKLFSLNIFYSHFMSTTAGGFGAKKKEVNFSNTIISLKSR